MFEHGYSTKPTDRTGRGVGLALVRDIVTAAGGRVELSAAPTAFRVTLPGAPSERRSG
ncbi:ATP-binding protein [Microbacterium sp.]|uniref:ATP-binding protein n=1 Tax=Microbacterium sp. TaxID=51671 RepID=UPI0025F853EE|nr:ATP-binding protein [Microbacterium sp.]